MTLMTLTGNYGFYPLLTLTLCLSLIDDTWLNSWTGSGLIYKGPYMFKLVVYSVFLVVVKHSEVNIRPKALINATFLCSTVHTIKIQFLFVICS